MLNPAIIYLCAAISVYLTNFFFYININWYDCLTNMIIYIISLPYTIIATKIFYHYVAKGVTIKSNELRCSIHAAMSFLAMSIFSLFPLIFSETSRVPSIRCFTNPFQTKYNIGFAFLLYVMINYLTMTVITIIKSKIEARKGDQRGSKIS